MTLIECFTSSHIDNIAACLRLRPDKMVMVGNADEMGPAIDRYRKLLTQRGQETTIIMCDVGKRDLADICAALDGLIKRETECVIDITGGDEAVIMAVGAMLAGADALARGQLRVEKYDYETASVVDCIHDNRKIPCKQVELTVAELIALHGGTMICDGYQPPRECTCADIAPLWRIASEDPKAWNKAIAYLNEFESRSESKTNVWLQLDKLHFLSDFDRKETVVRELLDKLHSCGAIEDRSSRDVLRYSYRSALLRHCTQKAGNILEVKTLLEGRRALENGAPCFRDCRMSVTIDWDGIVHTPSERVPETKNEIDVVLMKGTTPLFISCKNGEIGDEELYKLNTVAQRFGGPYARKMLIATDLDRKSPSANRAFIQRAWDMDIFLETDAGELTQEEWTQLLMKAIQ